MLVGGVQRPRDLSDVYTSGHLDHASLARLSKTKTFVCGHADAEQSEAAAQMLGFHPVIRDELMELVERSHLCVHSRLAVE